MGYKINNIQIPRYENSFVEPKRPYRWQALQTAWAMDDTTVATTSTDSDLNIAVYNLSDFITPIDPENSWYWVRIHAGEWRHDRSTNAAHSGYLQLMYVHKEGPITGTSSVSGSNNGVHWPLYREGTFQFESNLANTAGQGTGAGYVYARNWFYEDATGDVGECIIRRSPWVGMIVPTRYFTSNAEIIFRSDTSAETNLRQLDQTFIHVTELTLSRYSQGYTVSDPFKWNNDDGYNI